MCRCFFLENELFYVVEEIRLELDIFLYLYGKFIVNVSEGYISWDDLMLNFLVVDISKSFRSSFILVISCIYIFILGIIGNILKRCLKF